MIDVVEEFGESYLPPILFLPARTTVRFAWRPVRFAPAETHNYTR